MSFGNSFEGDIVAIREVRELTVVWDSGPSLVARRQPPAITSLHSPRQIASTRARRGILGHRDG